MYKRQVLINAEGKRFIDEVGTRDVVSAAEIAQTGSYSWLVVDQAMVCLLYTSISHQKLKKEKHPMEQNEKLRALETLQKKLYAYNCASNSRYLDAVTVAPKNTAEGRGVALSILAGELQKLMTAPETLAPVSYTHLYVQQPSGMAPRLPIFCISRSIAGIF